MNTMLLAAIAGFVWMEIWTVNVSRKKRDEAFDAGYYLKHNWTLILGNQAQRAGSHTNPLVTARAKGALSSRRQSKMPAPATSGGARHLRSCSLEINLCRGAPVPH